MHELALTRSILSIIESEAKKQGFARVLTIRLGVGEVSGVVPDCIRDFFPLASRGTVAEGARIESRLIPLAVRCRTCGREGRPEKGRCPVCGSEEITLVQGREFYVDSIEVQ